MQITHQTLKKQAGSLYQAGRLQESGAAYAQLCAQYPRDAEAWTMLGVIKGRLGLTQEAERLLRHAAELDPGNGAAWSNLGTLLQQSGRQPEAADYFERAVQLNPKDAIALNNLGTVLREQGRLDQAMECYRRAIQLKPRNAQAHNNLGTLLHEKCLTRAAIDSYRKALKAEPRFAQAHYNLGISLQCEGAHEQALYHYEKALQLDPGQAEVVAAIARLHEKEGRFAEAMGRIEPHLQASPTISILLAFAILSRRLHRQPEAIALLEQALAHARPTPIQRQEMEFALGDLHDDLGEYDTAFRHYQSANRSRPEPFDSAIYQAQVEAIRATADRSLPDRPRPAPESVPTPIFIVGMPRSGTSLIEQILASHPKVHGGGELPYLGEQVDALCQATGSPYPRCLTSSTDGQLEELGRKYRKQLRELAKTRPFATDKLPHNFLYLGLIRAALPNARIIHCLRDPLDTCLSIYFHNFNSNHPYARDLASLGQYYQGYLSLMEHWRALPGIKMYDVRYEDLIHDQETVTRALLEYCGLDWDDACLEFHKSKRIVNTPSYDQVRKPIYKRAAGRWQNYAQHLEPLAAALKGRPAHAE